MKKNITKFVLLFFVIFSFISIANKTFAESACASIASDIQINQSDTTENGNAVTTLQDFLYKNGYLTVSPTGYFGNSTLAAVKAFQVANGINATGYVGVLTRTKIQNLDCNYIVKSPVATSTTTSLITTNINCANLTSDLKIGQSSTYVTSLQNFLYKNGYLTVAPTGYFGSMTLTAVKAFQSANGLSADGYAGAITRAKIQSLDCKSTTSTTSTTNTTTNTLPIPGKLDSYAPVITFNVSPKTVEAGQSVELEWNAENAVDKCKITAKDSSGKVMNSTIDTSGLSMSGKVNKSTTFTLVCYNKYGIPGSKSVSVKITADTITNNTEETTYVKSSKITSVTPATANRGEVITIKGSDFLSTNSIYFDGTQISDSLILSQSSTSISFTIPEYKTCLTSYCVSPTDDTKIETGGKKIIQVSNANGFSNDFYITLPSKIITIAGVPTTTYAPTKLSLTSISPTSGNRGDMAIISGSGFSSESIVLFGGFKVADNLIIYKNSEIISFIIPPYQIGCTEPDYEICPKLPIAGNGLIIETGGAKTVSVMNKTTKATTTSATFTLPSKKITY